MAEYDKLSEDAFRSAFGAMITPSELAPWSKRTIPDIPVIPDAPLDPPTIRYPDHSPPVDRSRTFDASAGGLSSKAEHCMKLAAQGDECKWVCNTGLQAAHVRQVLLSSVRNWSDLKYYTALQSIYFSVKDGSDAYRGTGRTHEAFKQMCTTAMMRKPVNAERPEYEHVYVVSDPSQVTDVYRMVDQYWGLWSKSFKTNMSVAYFKRFFIDVMSFEKLKTSRERYRGKKMLFTYDHALICWHDRMPFEGCDQCFQERLR